MRHRRRDWTTAVLSWQVKTSSVWFYLSNGLPNTEPCRANGRVPSIARLGDKILRAAQLADDGTDDCAFGAMMSLVVRPPFRKLRFQMIADITQISSG
jgi:hypothetical protein